MKAIFNSREIDTSKPLIFSSNRAFCYGDGLFETIVTGQGRIDLLKFHLQRLTKGCHALGIELPSLLSEAYIRASIAQLSELNGLKDPIRAKLIVWRNVGGLYSPENDSSSFYLECKESQKPMIQGQEKIGFCNSFHNQYSPISFVKTTNALHYVMAGKEMKAQKWDDIILTDVKGNVSETHISNLFWYKKDKFYTPSLSTGCVEGVMRNYLIKGLRNLGQQVQEVETTPSELKEAELLFSTNASGISIFKSLINNEGLAFQPPNPELLSLFKQLLQP